jgi:hypothetical protein
MANSTPVPQNMPLYELLQQLMALSDDPQNAGQLIILNADGSFIGQTTLSTADIALANQALAVFLAARQAMEESTQTTVPSDSPEAVAQGIAELEAFLANDQPFPHQQDGGE